VLRCIETSFSHGLYFAKDQFETFEKCSILFKVKPPVPLPARRAYRSEGGAYAPEGKAIFFTTDIHSVFRG
jgi:hypothetical protein